MLLSPATFAPLAAAQDRERRASTATEQRRKENVAVRRDLGGEESRRGERVTPTFERARYAHRPLDRHALGGESQPPLKLLNASESSTAALPLETARVRVESRLLSPSSAIREPAYDSRLLARWRETKPNE